MKFSQWLFNGDAVVRPLLLEAIQVSECEKLSRSILLIGDAVVHPLRLEFIQDREREGECVSVVKCVCVCLGYLR